MEDEIPNGYDYNTDCHYRSMTYGKYKYYDKDNDEENEIVVSYSKQPFEGTDEITKAFTESYEVVYKWNSSANKFEQFIQSP